MQAIAELKADILVPILTQSEDWALLKICVFSRRDLAFQSSPSPKTGRYDDGFTAYPEQAKVPILTQSEDWALYSEDAKESPKYLRSNPHPVRRLGAMTVTLPNLTEWIVPILTQSEDWAL